MTPTGGVPQKVNNSEKLLEDMSVLWYILAGDVHGSLTTKYDQMHVCNCAGSLSALTALALGECPAKKIVFKADKSGQNRTFFPDS